MTFVASRRRGRPPGQDPIYRRIAFKLQEEIEGGTLKPGETLPSFQSLAHRFGTGERAIRLALNLLRHQGWLIRSSKRRLQIQFPPPFDAKRSLPVLEIVTLNLQQALSDSWLGALHEGVSISAGESELPLLTAHSHSYRYVYPTHLMSGAVSGIVFYGPGIHGPYHEFEKLAVPCVLLDVPDPLWKGHLCCVDNVAAASDATLRLIRMGHRRIAFIRHLVLWRTYIDPDSEEREKGFLEAFNKAGLPRPQNCLFNTSGYDRPGSVPMQKFLHAKPPFTAVVTPDLRRAQLVIDTLLQSGRSVPKDMSVVCFQGLDAADLRLAGPRADFKELGRQATGLLNFPKSKPKVVRLNAAWHDGASIGPPASR